MPGAPTAEPEALAAYLASLEREAGELGATLGEATWDDDHYEDKVEAVLAAPPAMVSFTFGLPARDVVRELQAAGTLVALTVTTEDEAALALAVGPDCLCLQGAEAGTHRGSFANVDRPGQDRPIRELTVAVARTSDVPLIAAGGVGGPERRGGVDRRRGGDGPGRDGLPALPRERRGGRVQGRARSTPPSARRRSRGRSAERRRAVVQRHGPRPPDAPAASRGQRTAHRRCAPRRLGWGTPGT